MFLKKRNMAEKCASRDPKKRERINGADKLYIRVSLWPLTDDSVQSEQLVSNTRTLCSGLLDLQEL